jgi:hypothetical protein
MKTTYNRRRGANLTSSRWAAYAAAGASSAFGTAATTEGHIHYSGEVNSVFRPPQSQSIGVDIKRSFPLEGGAYIVFEQLFSQSLIDYALFGIKGAAVSNEIRGRKGGGFGFGYPSNLDRGEEVSHGNFFIPAADFYAVLADNYYGGGHFHERGFGFIGFRFNTGAGTQYGWARILTTGDPKESFVVIDYAWGDPGDPITTGRRGLHNHPTMNRTSVPTSGSLGFLALGAAGLRAWRRQRAVEAQEL